MRVNLIERYSRADVGTLRVFRMSLGKKDRARSKVIAAEFVWFPRFGCMHVRVTDDRQIVFPRSKRQQAAGRQVEIPSRLCRRPHVLLLAILRTSSGAVDHLEADQAKSRVSGRGFA